MFPLSMQSWCMATGRCVKTDRKDAVKLANYGLDRWFALPKYIPEEDTRLLLKNRCRFNLRKLSYIIVKRHSRFFENESAGSFQPSRSAKASSHRT